RWWAPQHASMPIRQGGRSTVSTNSRSLLTQGHTARLMPPQYVKPFVKSNKNDHRDVGTFHTRLLAKEPQGYFVCSDGFRVRLSPTWGPGLTLSLYLAP